MPARSRRLWYFPFNADSIVVATGDAHLSPHHAIEKVITRVENFDGSISIYYTPLTSSLIARVARRARAWVTDELPYLGDVLAKSFDAPTPGQVNSWIARGHEFSLHPYVDTGLEKGWDRVLARVYRSRVLSGYPNDANSPSSLGWLG